MVLGVAQDGGHPQPGCRADCCVGKGVIPHLTTCVAVIDHGRAWLLDAGPDFRQHLTRLRDEGLELAGVLLTHGHIGHYTGLMFLGREAMNTSAMPVWAAPRLAAFLRTQGPWEQLVTGGNVALNVIATEQPISLSDRVTVTALPVPHRDEYSETVGFRVTGPDASLLYVPDTDSWEHWEVDIESHIASVEIALLDATFFDDAEVPHRDLTEIGHPTVSDSLLRFGRLPDTERAKIRFTHLNHSNPLLDPASDATVRVARAGMAVAVEGDVHEL